MQVQIVESDVGATIMGVTADNTLDFLLELVWSVARGGLQPGKFAVAVKAAAVQGDLSHTLADALWYASISSCVSELAGLARLTPGGPSLLLLTEAWTLQACVDLCKERLHRRRRASCADGRAQQATAPRSPGTLARSNAALRRSPLLDTQTHSSGCSINTCPRQP